MITPFYVKTEQFLKTYMKKNGTLERAKVGKDIVHILVRHVFVSKLQKKKVSWKLWVSYSIWYKSVVNWDAFLYFHV